MIVLLAGCQETGENNVSSEGEAEASDRADQMQVSEVLATLPEVKIGPLESRTVQQKVTCTGRIDIPPIDVFSVHSKTSGYVDMRQYISGDYIRKGTLLLTVTNPELVERQRILLETKAALELAEKDYQRKRLLKEENATTQRAYDESLAEKAQLEARYRGLRSELELLGIDLEKLERDFVFQPTHYVYARTSGHIHEIYITNGQHVDPETKLMDISDNDHIHLELNVLSKDVHLLEIGQKVMFMLPNNNHEYHAEIIKLNPMIDQESGTLNVHCHIEKEHEQHVKAGMFVNAEINVASVEVQGIPLEGTIKEGENYFGFFVIDGTLVKTLLDIPMVMDGFVTFENIPRGDVVLSGAYYLL